MNQKEFPAIRGTIVADATTSGLENFDILITGQKIGGTATAGALVENIISESQINTYFGRTSHIAKVLRATFKQLKKSTVKPKLNAIALDDNGTTKASGTFTITGTATEAGTLVFYVDSKTNGKYSIDVASGDTETVVAGNLVTAITNDLNANYSAANVAGVVTVTARNAGTNGNKILIVKDGSVAGLSVATSGDYLTGGATDPVLIDLFNDIETKEYKWLLYPSTWDYSFISDFVSDRFNVTRGLLYGTAVQTKVDSYANLSALYASYPEDKAILRGRLSTNMLVENPDVMSAQLIAKASLFHTPSADVDFAQIITTGGIANIGLPYANFVFNDVVPFTVGTGFSKEENDALDSLGSFTWYNNQSNTNVLLGELFTGYVKNDLGADDDTFKYQTTVDISTYTRRYLLKNLQNQFQRSKLTTGIGSDKVASYGGMKNAIMTYYKELAIDYEIVINGNDLFDDVEKVIDLNAVIDLSAGSYSTVIRVYPIGQVRFIDLTFVVKI